MKNHLSMYILAVSLFFTPIYSQTSTFSLGELNPYFKEYLKPMALGMTTGMGHGWSHDVKPHDKWGFDLSVSAVLVEIPNSELMFSSSALTSLTANGYQFLDASGNLITNFELPTISSDQTTNISIQRDINPNGGTPVDMELLDGLMPYAYAPNFAVQLAAGLPLGTEVMVRFLPNMASTINEAADIEEIKVNDLSIWGLGVKHDIKQWIPSLSDVKLLDVSALLAFSVFNLDVGTDDFPFTPEELLTGVNINYKSGLTSADFERQGFDMNMKSLNGALLFGLNIPVVRPFVGVGFNRATVSTGLTGTLPLIYYIDDDNVDIDIDPVGLRVDAEKTFINFQTGVSLKLLFLTLYGQYTYQQYSMYSAGISLGFK